MLVPGGLQAGVVRGVAVQGADRLVAARHRVDLLPDYRRRLGAEHHGGAAAQGGFQLGEAGFQLPARRVGARRACSRVSRPGSRMSVTRVKVSEVWLPSSEVTEYSMTRTVMPGMSFGSAPLRRIRREADRQAIRDRPVPSGSTCEHRQVHVAFRAPQHVHAIGEHIGEQPVAQEVPVAQQQIPGLKLCQQLPGQRLLPGGQRRGRRAEHRSGPHTPRAPPRGSAETGRGRRRCPGSRTPPRSPGYRAGPRRIPSTATGRIPATNAGRWPSPASGPAVSSSSRSITRQPSRWRA